MDKRTMLSRGFSLMEILIVITIIGILTAVIVPSVNEARDKGLIAATQMELDHIKSAMGVMYNDTGYYPNGAASYCRTTPPVGNEVDLSLPSANLVANGGGLSGWDGPYVPVAVDKWGTPYYLDEDYQCFASTTGCRGVDDAGTDSSVIVSCGPNKDVNGGSCEYDTDNIVYRLCN